MSPDNRIYLVRHAKPSAEWGGADGDPGLDTEGHRQAAASAGVLLEAAPAIRRVVSSPMKRCRETAEAFARTAQLDILVDPAVGELPTPVAVAVGDRPAWMQIALHGRWSDIPGELDYDSWRIGVTEGALSYPGAVVFTHFIAINAIVATLTGGDRVVGFEPDFASITVLARGDAGWTVAERGREAATSVL